MKTQAIVPTAGLGTRMETSVPKPLVKINDKPIIVHTLEAIAQSALIESIIVAAHDSTIDQLEKLIKDYGINKAVKLVVGGETRSDSVLNALDAADDNTEIILVHDGARPLIVTDIINEAIIACNSSDAVVVAVPAKSTFKLVDASTALVTETVDRDRLWEVQTPQVFKKNILVRAHHERKDMNPTDDAALVEQLGVPVMVLKGSYRNIKITTNEDLIVVQAFFDAKNS